MTSTCGLKLLGRVVLTTALLPNSHADDVLFGICNLAASLINRLFYSLIIIIIIKIDVPIALRNCNIREREVLYTMQQ